MTDTEINLKQQEDGGVQLRLVAIKNGFVVKCGAKNQVYFGTIQEAADAIKTAILRAFKHRQDVINHRE